MSLGQFSLNFAALPNFCRGVSVQAYELDISMTNEQRSTVYNSIAIVYLVTLNGIALILRGRQSLSQVSREIPPCLPLSISEMPTVDFVNLVRLHKSRLETVYDEDFINKITDQQRLLKRAVANEPVLRSNLENIDQNLFHEAWKSAGSRFRELRVFSEGMACILPTTARVEGDFSQMGYRRDASCAGLSDFSLEGIMHAKQFRVLEKAIRNVKHENRAIQNLNTL